MYQHPGVPCIIKISASISHPTISLSNLPLGPIILKLALRLENSPGPITISRQWSCLTAEQERVGPHSSFWLTPCNPAVDPPGRSGVYILYINGRTINIDGGNENLMTLSPGVPVEADVIVADFNPTSKLGTTHLCGARLNQLVPGERYEVEFQPNGKRTWWWTMGTKAGVIVKYVGLWSWLRGVKGFDLDQFSSETRYGLSFEAERLPEILIEK